MERAKTDKEKCALLKMRAARLIYLIETFNGKPDIAIEQNAYLVLETYQSRPRAIWRYLRFAVREWRNKQAFMFEFRLRVFYYRRVKGLKLNAAIDLAHETIEDRIFASMKGGA